MATPVKPTGRAEILDAVLDAAERLFAANGPADVSLRAIAAEAGVTYGLVHRHFGTKDVLFDRLLERYSQRWTPRLDTLGYEGALEQFLGRDADTGPYLRLLAWTLLSDRGDEPGDEPGSAPGRHAELDRLLALRNPDDPEAAIPATAAALALAFGWRFFQPFIRDALHLEHDEQLLDVMRDELRRITSPPPVGSTG